MYFRFCYDAMFADNRPGKCDAYQACTHSKGCIPRHRQRHRIARHAYILTSDMRMSVSVSWNAALTHHSLGGTTDSTRPWIHCIFALFASSAHAAADECISRHESRPPGTKFDVYDCLAEGWNCCRRISGNSPFHCGKSRFYKKITLRLGLQLHSNRSSHQYSENFVENFHFILNCCVDNILITRGFCWRTV